VVPVVYTVVDDAGQLALRAWRWRPADGLALGRRLGTR
jgi:hypothetical protein